MIVYDNVSYIMYTMYNNVINTYVLYIIRIK